ncbi:MAG: TonB-dependent receptor [Tannerella sp.]|nr:TonB-dependent receptor [Tannerella sp.]
MLVLTFFMALTFSFAGAQQNVTVKGKILDSGGIPLAGASVIVKGTSQGINSNEEGDYSISNVPVGSILEFRLIGFVTEERKVENETGINVVMIESSESLEEVTLVAFGKQKKESVLASITTVRPADLKVPSSNLSTALAGRIAGLVSYQSSGEPGMDDANFFVRGVTSLKYANGPLILIDGVEMTSSDLSRMQPDDIESFSIMKDAAATALYGARGANGVILIATKEGREGQASISLRLETSLSTPTQTIDLVDPVSYMKLNNEAVLTRNRMATLPYSMEKIDNTANPNRNQYVYPANDWYKMLFNNYTFNHRVNFNVSGGGKVARYYIAATFNQDNGVLKVDRKNNFNNNIDLKRYLLRSNVNINVTKTTEAIVRLHGTFDDYQGPIDGGDALYEKVMRSDPVLFPPLYAADETYAYVQHILFGNADQAQYINPYADMVKGYKEYNKSNILAQFELKQNLDFFTKGLTVRGLFNTTRYSNLSIARSYVPYYYAIANYDKYQDKYRLYRINENGREYLGEPSGTKEINTVTYAEAAINYDRTFAGKHALSGMIVATMRNKLEGDVSSLQLSLPHRNSGVSGRLTYSYDNRYFTEFNFGYNGSERFAENERFGFFPSFGVGWILSNESFWNENLKKTVSLLKLKGTYGLAGNDAIGDSEDRFFYMSEVNMDYSGRAYSFGYDLGYYSNGIAMLRYANENITWETARKLNLGLELGLFGKIDVIVDYYTENRSGILLPRSGVPATMGLWVNPEANLGKAFGQGVDLSVDYNHSFNKDFWISGRANFTYAVTEYTRYEEPDNSATPWLSRVGYPVSQQWGYVAERLFVDDYEVNNSPSQASFGEYAGGDIKYKDINGDGEITSLDMVPTGYPTEPQIIYGFGMSTGYKGFDFSFFFQGLAQRSFWLSSSTVPFVDTDGNGSITSKNAMIKAYADSHWSEDNKDIYALWPRLADRMIGNNYSVSNTWFMRDGGFMRLKSVEMGYTLPEKITGKIRMKTFRIYLSGTNLLTFSKFKLWDPEMAGNGLGYPIQRVFNVGVQLTF